jgi:DNA (cytosine-5)-methyltransferase 1
MNYYNEWEPFAGEWLKELIKDGLIPDGTVDNRSIADVEPSDLKGFTQCHFFAGIGGWSRALELARWSPERPVWTGSPPCQPFSAAGNHSGKDDERHLWPVFFNLISKCRPPTIFGEQVASAIRFGWLDDLQTDLEAQGYAAAAVVLPSGGIGAPHKRERLFFVADSLSQGLQGHGQSGQEQVSQERQGKERHSAEGGLRHSSVGDSKCFNDFPCEYGAASCFWDNSTIIHCRDGKYRPIPTEPALFPLANGLSNRVGILRGAGNAIVPQAAAEIIKAFMETYIKLE